VNAANLSQIEAYEGTKFIYRSFGK